MTILDLRIKYRFELGYSPTHGRDAYGHNYKGELTHYYAEWLEDSLGGVKMQRLFQEETGYTPTFRCYVRKLCYRSAYKNWLEEKYLENAQSN